MWLYWFLFILLCLDTKKYRRKRNNYNKLISTNDKLKKEVIKVAKKKKPKEEVFFNLGEELEKLAVKYRTLQDEIDGKQKELEAMKKQLKEDLKHHNIENGRSQIIKVNLKKIKTTKLAQKKLKENLEALNLGYVYDNCLYNSEYDRLRVSWIKGGKNIF